MNGCPPFEDWNVIILWRKKLVHGPSYLDTIAKILEGGKIINPLKCQLIIFSGKNKLKS